jgi:hypothetical protein
MMRSGRLKNVLWVVGKAHMPRKVSVVATSRMAQSSARCYAQHKAVPGLSRCPAPNGAVRRLLSQKVGPNKSTSC